MLPCCLSVTYIGPSSASSQFQIDIRFMHLLLVMQALLVEEGISDVLKAEFTCRLEAAAAAAATVIVGSLFLGIGT